MRQEEDSHVTSQAGRGEAHSRSRRPTAGRPEGNTNLKNPEKWLESPDKMVPSLPVSSEPWPCPGWGRTGGTRSLSDSPGPGDPVLHHLRPPRAARGKDPGPTYPASPSGVGPANPMMGLRAPG